MIFTQLVAADGVWFVPQSRQQLNRGFCSPRQKGEKERSSFDILVHMEKVTALSKASFCEKQWEISSYFPLLFICQIESCFSVKPSFKQKS